MPRPSDPHAKSRLLEAAERVFSEKGLDRAKVEDITTQAGSRRVPSTCTSTVRAMPSKSCCPRCSRTCKRAWRAAKSVCLLALDQSLEQSLEQWLARDLEMFEFIWKNRALMRITLEGGRSADYQHLIEHFASNAQSETEVLLRRGITMGVYRKDLDVEVAAAFIAGGYDRFARQLVRETKKPDLRKRLRELRWMVISGAGTPALINGLYQLHAEKDDTPPPSQSARPAGTEAESGPASAVLSKTV